MVAPCAVIDCKVVAPTETRWTGALTPRSMVRTALNCAAFGIISIISMQLPSGSSIEA